MLYLSPASNQLVRDAMRVGLLGQILGVNAGNRLEPGVPTALDDGCFPDGCFALSWDEAKWRRFIERRSDEHTLFVVVPDVPYDADRTTEAFDRFAPDDVPVAYATQNGCTDAHVPWDRIDCLFTAGDDAWKLGTAARALADKAKALGKWTHMGRVNSLRRLRLASREGYDSVDGTYLAHGPDTNLPKLLRFLAHAHHPTLDGVR